MEDLREQIADGLERVFAERGFADPTVGDLRDAAGVSLRTLYRYHAARSDMVRAALDHRHERYLAHIFGKSVPSEPASLRVLLKRIASWMKREASHGCLFHAAVAAAPEDESLKQLLHDHKKEVIDRLAFACNLNGKQGQLMILVEGLTQTWPLHGPAALRNALSLASLLQTDIRKSREVGC